MSAVDDVTVEHQYSWSSNAHWYGKGSITRNSHIGPMKNSPKDHSDCVKSAEQKQMLTAGKAS